MEHVLLVSALEAVLVLRFTITVTDSGAEAPGSQGARRKNTGVLLVGSRRSATHDQAAS
jgi:hypothetical protein